MFLYPFHEVYRDTRQVLAGLSIPKPPYQAIAAWIAEQPGGANVLNVAYWTFVDKPSLFVVMEREADVAALEENVTRQQILGRFRQILVEQRNKRIVTDDMRVVIGAFAPAARAEASGKIPVEKIFGLLFDLDDPTIWLLKPRGEYLRVFFHTEEQRLAAESSGIGGKIVERFGAVVKPYDEFDAFRDEPIKLVYFSREYFESVYKGSWQNFDHDN